MRLDVHVRVRLGHVLPVPLAEVRQVRLAEQPGESLPAADVLAHDLDRGGQRDREDRARNPPDRAPEDERDHHGQREEPDLPAHDEGRQDVALEKLQQAVGEKDEQRLLAVVLEVRDGDRGKRREEDADVGQEDRQAGDRSEHVVVVDAERHERQRGHGRHDQHDEAEAERVGGHRARDRTRDVRLAEPLVAREDAGEHAVELLPVLQHEEREERHGGGVEQGAERLAELDEHRPRRLELGARDLDLAHSGARLLGQDRAHPLADAVDEVRDLADGFPDPRLVAGQGGEELVELRRHVDHEQRDAAHDDEEDQQDREHPRDPRALEQGDEGTQGEGEEEGECDRNEKRAAVVEEPDDGGGRDRGETDDARGRAVRDLDFVCGGQKTPSRGGGSKKLGSASRLTSPRRG